MLNLLFSDKSIYILIAVILAVLLIYALIRYKQNVLLITLLCIALLGGGVYSGCVCYTFYSTQNSVIGEPETHQPYEDFNFYQYDLKNIVWYEAEDGMFKYEITYPTSIKFIGEEDKYQLLVNNSPCKETKSTNGKLYGIFEKEFIDIDGKMIDRINFEISFAFYTSEIRLEIKTSATKENIGLVREYVEVNGFDLRIIDSVYVSA